MHFWERSSTNTNAGHVCTQYIHIISNVIETQIMLIGLITMQTDSLVAHHRSPSITGLLIDPIWPNHFNLQIWARD